MPYITVDEYKEFLAYKSKKQHDVDFEFIDVFHDIESDELFNIYKHNSSGHIVSVNIKLDKKYVEQYLNEYNLSLLK